MSEVHGELQHVPESAEVPAPAIYAPESVSAALANPFDTNDTTLLQRYIRDSFVANVGEEVWNDEVRTPWDRLDPSEVEMVFRHLMRVYQKIGNLLAPEAARHTLRKGPDTDAWIALLYAGRSPSEIFERYDMGNGTAVHHHYNSKERKLERWMGRVYRLWLGWGDPYELPAVPLIELDNLEP